MVSPGQVLTTLDEISEDHVALNAMQSVPASPLARPRKRLPVASTRLASSLLASFETWIDRAEPDGPCRAGR